MSDPIFTQNELAAFTALGCLVGLGMHEIWQFGLAWFRPRATRRAIHCPPSRSWAVVQQSNGLN